jgi:hypothetical protein
LTTKSRPLCGRSGRRTPGNRLNYRTNSSGTRVAEENCGGSAQQGDHRMKPLMNSLKYPLAIATVLALPVVILKPPAGGIAPPAYAQKGKGPGYAPEAFVNAAPIATGLLRRFLVNPQGEVDGLMLVGGDIIKFPPHMSENLVAAVRPGDSISVRGFREPGGDIKAIVIVNEASRQQVIEQPPAPGITRMPKHLRFGSLARLQVTGAVERALRGRSGEVNGALLADGTTIRFPPPAAFDLAALLQPGQTLAAEGLGTENVYGKGVEATAMGESLTALRPIYRR